MRNIRTFLVELSLQSRYNVYVKKYKHIQSFYMVRQLPTSIGVCLDAIISTNLIKGLQLVLCGTRLPLLTLLET